jgi:hypothetical protein
MNKHNVEDEIDVEIERLEDLRFYLSCHPEHADKVHDEIYSPGIWERDRYGHLTDTLGEHSCPGCEDE